MDHKDLSTIRTLSAVWTAIGVLTTILRWWMRWPATWSRRALVKRGFIYESCTFIAISSQIFQLVLFSLPVSALGPGRSYARLSTFYLIVWNTRIALLSLFVTSSDTSGQPLPWFKRQFLFMMFAYVVIMCGLIVQAAIVCHNSRHEWETKAVPHCPLGLQVAISHYIVDAAADSLLFYKIFSLLWLLQGMSRWRILGSFACYVATIITSIIHATYILKGDPVEEVTAGVVECGVGIVAGNMPFLVAYIYRHLGTANCVHINNSPEISRQPESPSMLFANHSQESITALELKEMEAPHSSSASNSLVVSSLTLATQDSAASLVSHRK